MYPQQAFQGLPAKVSILAGPDVWMEGCAVEQLSRTARLDGCVRAVGLPDLHAGRGGPVGAAFAFLGAVHPGLIGSDVGCGVRLMVTRVKRPSMDRLERRVRSALDRDPLGSGKPLVLKDALWRAGPASLSEIAGLCREAQVVAELEEALPPVHAEPWGSELDWASLGSIGGGNHFAEISVVDQVLDEAYGQPMGLKAGRLAVVIHSGSRRLGQALAERWRTPVLHGGDIRRYLVDLEGARRIAEANRLLLASQMLKAIGACGAAKIAGSMAQIHNFVSHEVVDGDEVLLHRKGVTRVTEGEPAIVLGSRGAPSWILRGVDTRRCLYSMSHGAGRRMTRMEAHAKMKHKYRKHSLLRTDLGGRVICDDAALLYQEHPEAYKPLSPVIESLIAAGVALPVARLKPLITVKR